MNLAEIRKKAENAKKTVPPPVNSPPVEVEIEIWDPEQELEMFAAEAEAVVTESPVTQGDTLSEMQPEPIVPVLEATVQTVAESAVSREHPAAMEMSPKELLQPGAASQIAAPAGPLPVATVARAAYNPLATILSGREESADPEEASAFQQLSLSAADIEEYLCFRVADEEYALSIMAIKEIIKPREVTEVPRMPNFIAGVISLRGLIIPVMDMRLRLSLSVREATGKERVIVLRADAGFCGVLVDEVVQVARIRKADIEEPPAVLDEIDRDFVKGLGHFDNRMIILLNLETIIDISIH